MATQTSRKARQPNLTHRLDPRDEDNFVQKFTERLTKYYISIARCTQRIQREYSVDQLELFEVRYNAVLEAFHADPVRNPVHSPTNSDEIREFFRKCDELCLNDPRNFTIDQCLHIVCGLNYGAQFVTSYLSGHPKKAEIMRIAADRGTEERSPKKPTTEYQPWETLVMDQTVLLKDPANIDRAPQLYRFLDHGSTAMKGEFWVFKAENGQDQTIELSADELHERLILSTEEL